MTKLRKISLSELSRLVETWDLGSGKVFPSPLLDHGDSLSCDCSSVIRETGPRSVCPPPNLDCQYSTVQYSTVLQYSTVQYSTVA